MPNVKEKPLNPTPNKTSHNGNSPQPTMEKLQKSSRGKLLKNPLFPTQRKEKSPSSSTTK